MLSEKPWRGGFVLLFCAAQFISFFAGATAIALLHKIGAAGFQSENGLGTVLFATLCFQGATWILIPPFLWVHGIGVRGALGFRQAFFPRAFFLAIAVAIVILPIALALQDISVRALQHFGWHVEDEAAVALVAGAKSLPLKIYLGIFAVVLAPVAEEFIFRGMLFPLFQRLGRPRCAWLGVSALFALIHFDAAIFVPLFCFALALTWLYETTDNLLAPMLAHSLFNAANLALLYFAPTS